MIKLLNKKLKFTSNKYILVQAVNGLAQVESYGDAGYIRYSNVPCEGECEYGYGSKKDAFEGVSIHRHSSSENSKEYIPVCTATNLAVVVKSILSVYNKFNGSQLNMLMSFKGGYIDIIAFSSSMVAWARVESDYQSGEDSIYRIDSDVLGLIPKTMRGPIQIFEGDSELVFRQENVSIHLHKGEWRPKIDIYGLLIDGMEGLKKTHPTVAFSGKPIKTDSYFVDMASLNDGVIALDGEVEHVVETLRVQSFTRRVNSAIFAMFDNKTVNMWIKTNWPTLAYNGTVTLVGNLFEKDVDNSKPTHPLVRKNNE